MFDRRFAGRTAIVTGGASGLGRDVTRRLVAEGGKVIVWDHDAAALSEAAEEQGVLATRLVNVSSWTEVEAAAIAARDIAPAIDILVNSAGVRSENDPVEQFQLDSWQAVVELNVSGTFYACRAVVPAMVGRGYGRVVNVACIAGKKGNPYASAFSASEAGVIAFTKSLAKELANTGVRVNAVTPAVIDSSLLAQMPQSHIDMLRSKVSLGRLGRDETTETICFLVSEECSFSTAATFGTSGAAPLSDQATHIA